MSSAHSYEAGLHDLEKELDAQPKPRKERSFDTAPKKDNFVRTVGFAPGTASSPSLASPLVRPSIPSLLLLTCAALTLASGDGRLI